MRPRSYCERATASSESRGAARGRAHKIDELEVKRDATVGPAELTAAFGSWIQVLRGELEGPALRGLLPQLWALVLGPSCWGPGDEDLVMRTW